MSEIAGRTSNRGSAATAIVHESYSFACMRCGHGWEQSYEIEHHLDAEGAEFVMYVANGHVVPSPLSRPSCQNCDSHVVRIMRPGQVSSVLNSMRHEHRPLPRRTEEALEEHVPEEHVPEEPQASSAASAAPAGSKEHHHWHLSDLLHPFHHRKAS